MKKLMVFVLCLVLLCGCLPVAADTPAVVTCTPSAVSLQRGESFYVTVSVERSPSVSALAITMGDAWDDNVFELVSAEWLLTGGMIKNVDMVKQNAIINFATDRSFDGEVFQLELRVKEDSGIGHSIIDVGAVFESAAANIPVTRVSCEVEIVCYHNWKAADCAYPEICTDCGTTRGEALGHVYAGNECSRCGLTKSEAATTATTTVPTRVITTTMSTDTTSASTGRQPDTITSTAPTGDTTTGGTTAIDTTTGGTVTRQTGPGVTSTSTQSVDRTTIGTATGETGAPTADGQTGETVAASGTQPSRNTATAPGKTGDDYTWLFILLCVVVVAGIGTGVVLVLRRKGKH